MSIVFKDFGTAYLAAPLAVGERTLTVDSPSSLPVLQAGDYFYLVLQKYSDRSYVEIVKVTATAGSVYTIQRGQAGTIARTFALGDYAELRLTVDGLSEFIAQGISAKMDKSGGGDFTGLYRFLDSSSPRVEIVRTSDSSALSVVLDFSASDGHRAIFGGPSGANAVTPSILFRPNGYASGAGQVKIDKDGLIDAVSLVMRSAQRTESGAAVRYDELSKFVPKTQIINGHDFSANFDITADDVFTAAPVVSRNARFDATDFQYRDVSGTYGIRLVASSALSILQGGKTVADSADQRLHVTGWLGKQLSEFKVYADGPLLRRVAGVDYPLYDALNKPSAADIGAWPSNKVQQGVGSWDGIKGKVPCITEAGVIELGQIVDLHESGSTSDYSWRIDVGASGVGKASIFSEDGSEILRLNKTGSVGIPSGGLNASGIVRVNRSQAPMFELQIPGSKAVANYLANDNSWRFVTSDGNGGEVSPRFVSLGTGDFLVTGKVLSASHASCPWTGLQQGAFRVSAAVPLVPDSLTKVFSYRAERAGNWTLDQSIGSYLEATGVANDLSHVLVSTDGASYTRIWKFRNDGRLQSPSNWRLEPDGNLFGSAWGNTFISNWAVSNFAPISDIRYKKNITECEGQALDVIDRFRFYAYDWDDSKEIVAGKYHVRFGVSAQDMELIDRAYVREAEVREEIGEDPTIIKTLDDSNLLTLALKAIQELKARVEFLESRAV